MAWPIGYSKVTNCDRTFEAGQIASTDPKKALEIAEEITNTRQKFGTIKAVLLTALQVAEKNPDRAKAMRTFEWVCSETKRVYNWPGGRESMFKLIVPYLPQDSKLAQDAEKIAFPKASKL